MKDKRFNTLLQLLNSEDYHTAEWLSGHLKVSVKTVRNLVKKLGEKILTEGAHLESKSRLGYRLVIDDPEAFQSFVNNGGNSDYEEIPNSSKERIGFLLKYLLGRKDFIKLDELSDKLFISKKTLSHDLKEVETILQEYDLLLIRKPYYGIKIQGEELELRRCIVHHGNENLIPVKTLGTIADCVSDCLRRNHYIISDVAFENLVLHLYIAVMRIREEHEISLKQEDLEELIKRQEYRIAVEIVQEMKKLFSVDFPDSEIGYVTIHLAGKMNYGESGRQNDNLVISRQISNVVTEMLQVVYDAFRYDFRGDLELRMSLSQHIVPLEVRMKYNLNLNNPLLQEIKEHFSLPYAMASQASGVLKKVYHRKLSEDEIAYIALPFALALERQKTTAAKKNILLVCSSGKGSAQLLVYKYQKEFGMYLNRIETCSVSTIDLVDFSDIDYVFATVPISVKIPVPIQNVQFFLESKDIQNVRKVLSGNMKSSMEKYYRKDIFLPHVSMKSKEEILRFLCNYLVQHLGVPDTLYDSVMKREEFAQTEFGNLVAMPHPYQVMSKETYVCVAVLDEPVRWTERDVSVVFLVLIEDRKEKDLQKFYQITSNFLLDEQRIQDLIRRRDYDQFIRELGRVEQELEEI